MFGSWNVNVQIGKMPQDVADAFENLELFGAQYTLIAYLGSQVVNGTNHAILAEQLLTTGKDVKNVVLMIFNEKEGKIALSNIERVVEEGAPLGGTVVDVKTDIPDDAKNAFDTAFDGFVGSNVKPFALLATKLANGTNYLFAAEVEPVVLNPVKSVQLVSVYSNGQTSFADLLANNNAKLGYAFTW